MRLLRDFGIDRVIVHMVKLEPRGKILGRPPEQRAAQDEIPRLRLTTLRSDSAGAEDRYRMVLEIAVGRRVGDGKAAAERFGQWAGKDQLGPGLAGDELPAP